MDPTRTTTVLLDGLHDPANEGAWLEFDARYRPVVMGFARKLGLSDADATDAAQETMLRFIEEYRANRYDRSRARLGAWLIAIARTKVAMVYRKRSQKREARGESAMIDLDNDAQLSVIWEDQRRATILQKALDELRTGTRLSDHTIRAFELLVVRQMPVTAVADEMQMTAQEVYLAKSRIAGKLRDIIARLEEAYDEEAP